MNNIIIFIFIIFIISSCKSDSNRDDGNVDTREIKKPIDIEYKLKNGLNEYFLPILDSLELKRNIPINELLDYLNQDRRLFTEKFKNTNFPEESFYITDSIMVFEKTGTVTFFLGKESKFIEIYIKDNDKISMQILHNKILSYLDKTINKSKQTEAPGSFEINNFWNKNDYKLEMSFYNDKEIYFIKISM